MEKKFKDEKKFKLEVTKIRNREKDVWNKNLERIQKPTEDKSEIRENLRTWSEMKLKESGAPEV